MAKVVAHKSLADISPQAWEFLRGAVPGSTVFQSYGWQQAWLDAAGDGVEPLILRLVDGQSCAGIAPLCLVRDGQRRVVRFIGDPRIDYAGFIISAEAPKVLAQIFEFLAGHLGRDVELELNNIPFSPSTYGVLERAACRHGFWCVEQPRELCPSLVLKDGGAQALAKESLRRHRKHLQGMGLEVKHLSSSEEIQPWLNAFFTQHIQRWCAHGPQSLFIDRRNRDLYRNLVRDLAVARQILFTVLTVEGKPAAFHFGFVDGKKLLWYKPSFDVALARYSPGEVLLGELIAYAMHQGFDELDFTRGDEVFKSRFATTVRQNVSFVFGRTWPGRVRRAGAQVLHRMPGLRPRLSAVLDLASTVRQVLCAPQIVAGMKASMAQVKSPCEQYEQPQLVARYRREQEIQKPEAAILAMLGDRLAAFNMLDIGVGAGRTSVYFANLVKGYWGIDVAPKMVEAARLLQGDLIPADKFHGADARCMEKIPGQTMDFVLISYNGIDCVPENDRWQIFREVQRVSRPGAWFSFSSHNQQSLTWRGGPGLGWRTALSRYALLRAANPRLPDAAAKPSSFIMDASGYYHMPVYYIAPGAQAAQLTGLGFKDVQVFSLTTGRAVEEAGWGALKDAWLYYVCRV